MIFKAPPPHQLCKASSRVCFKFTCVYGDYGFVRELEHCSQFLSVVNVIVYSPTYVCIKSKLFKFELFFQAVVFSVVFWQ